VSSVKPSPREHLASALRVPSLSAVQQTRRHFRDMCPLFGANEGTGPWLGESAMEEAEVAGVTWIGAAAMVLVEAARAARRRTY
jgi:hypothetical protein